MDIMKLSKDQDPSRDLDDNFKGLRSDLAVMREGLKNAADSLEDLSRLLQQQIQDAEQ